MKNIALILAAGSGKRFDQNLPKQFVKINDKELLFYCINTFYNAKNIDEIYLVFNKEYLNETKVFIQKYSFKNIFLVEGGSSREESVFFGLKKIKENNSDAIVLIHDSARPLVSERIINDNISTVCEFGSATTAIPATDSVYVGDTNGVNKEIKRSSAYLAQTPQSSLLSTFLNCFENCDYKNETDDAGVLLKNGITPHIVEGDTLNFKITTQEDIFKLKFSLKNL